MILNKRNGIGQVYRANPGIGIGHRETRCIRHHDARQTRRRCHGQRIGTEQVPRITPQDFADCHTGQIPRFDCLHGQGAGKKSDCDRKGVSGRSPGNGNVGGNGLLPRLQLIRQDGKPCSGIEGNQG